MALGAALITDWGGEVGWGRRKQGCRGREGGSCRPKPVPCRHGAPGTLSQNYFASAGKTSRHPTEHPDPILPSQHGLKELRATNSHTPPPFNPSLELSVDPFPPPISTPLSFPFPHPPSSGSTELNTPQSNPPSPAAHTPKAPRKHPDPLPGCSQPGACSARASIKRHCARIARRGAAPHPVPPKDAYFA